MRNDEFHVSRRLLAMKMNGFRRTRPVKVGIVICKVGSELYELRCLKTLNF